MSTLGGVCEKYPQNEQPGLIYYGKKFYSSLKAKWNENMVLIFLFTYKSLIF